MNLDLAQHLARLINEEKALVVGFVELLKREERLLILGEIDPLLALANEKTAHYRALQRLSDERIGLFARARVPLDRKNIEAVLAARPEALACWQELVILARDAHERNRVNGQLITENLRNNQQALSTLLMAAEQPQIYGPDGQSRLSASSRHFGSC